MGEFGANRDLRRDDSGHDDGADIICQGSHGGDVAPRRVARTRGIPGWAGWRPTRAAAILGMAGLVAGLAAGYAAGRAASQPRAASGTAGRSPAGPSPQSTPADGAARAGASPAVPPLAADIPVLTQTIGACSAQLGPDLQLGIQVANLSSGTVTLRRVVPDLPIGGLAMISEQWEPCGGLPTGDPGSGDVVGPSSTSWFSVTFKVLEKCPRPFPVQFTVEYEYAGRTSKVQLPGFADLSQVSYSGCPAAAS